MNLEVDADVAGRVQEAIGRVGNEDAIGEVGSVGVTGAGTEEADAHAVNVGGRRRDTGREAGVRDPAAIIGTLVGKLFAIGAHSAGARGRKAEGVDSMLLRGAKVWAALLESSLMLRAAGESAISQRG